MRAAGALVAGVLAVALAPACASAQVAAAGAGGRSLAVVPAVVTGPVAVDDYYQVQADAVLSVPDPGVLANDTNPDAHPLYVIGTVKAATGTVVWSPYGPSAGGFDYTPRPGFSGTDTIVYRCMDTVDSRDATAGVYIRVNTTPTPNATMAVDRVRNDTTTSVAAPKGLATAFTDREGNPLTITVTSPPATGTLTPESDGAFSYRPPSPPGSFTGTVTVGLTAYDGMVTSPEVVMAIRVRPKEEFRPEAVAHEYAASWETTLRVNPPELLVGCTDPEGRVLKVVQVATNTACGGRVSIGMGGGFIYRAKPGSSGTDTFQYRVYDDTGLPSLSATVTIHVAGPPPHVATVTRVGGADRYAVAVGMARLAFPAWRTKGGTGPVIGTVIIACGSDAKAADPLGAAGLSGAAQAPLLLVRTDTAMIVPLTTIDALKSIIAARGGVKPEIVVVGGPATVTLAQWNVLKAYASSIKRIGGLDRYEVAANVAYEVRRRSGGANPRFVLIAAGHDPARFFEPLALGAVASANRVPVLLMKGSIVPPATLKAAGSLAPSGTVRYLGANATVVNETARMALGVPAANRICGVLPNRESFAGAVADAALARGWLKPAKAGVANKLADALGGGTALGILGGPVLYTDPYGGLTIGSPTVLYMKRHKPDIDAVYAAGGVASVPDLTLTLMRKLWP